MKRQTLPSRDELLSFIRERNGKVGAREIARAFGAKNADRAAVNRMLRELTDDGQIERRRKRLHHAGVLPPVVLADITGRDRDGELLARPTEWDEDAHGAPPIIRIVIPRRARPGEIAGVGDRALLRVDRRDDEMTGRIIKLIDQRQAARPRYFPQFAKRRRPPGPDRQKTIGPRTDDRRRPHRRRG